MESRSFKPSRKDYRKLSRFSRNFFIVLIVLFFLSIVVWETWYLFFRTTYFDISKIEIYGNNFVSSEKIKSKSELIVNTNIFNVNGNVVEKKIEALPQIESAKLERIGLSTIRITVKERKPLALILIAGIFYEIDKKNTLFAMHDSNIRIDLPIITGIDLKSIKLGKRIYDRRIIKVTRWLSPISTEYLTRISEIHFEGDIMTFRLTTGEKVLVGDVNTFKKLYNLLIATLEKFKNQNLPIDYIDMRFNNEIVVKPEEI